MWTSYHYRELPGFKSTDQVRTVDYSFGDKNKSYSYSYDKLGNITSVSGNNSLPSSYEYDEAGQLIRVNDGVQDKTFTYQYDVGGNIRSVKEHDYTTGTPGAVTNTVSYVYGDSNWKDKLTSYDSKPITYDAIGNPLTYDGWTYSWEGGRRLASMSRSGTALSFTYDDVGIRTSKTVNGTTTEYTTADGRITSQKTGNDYTLFRYDESGSLLSLNWDGDEYFYVLNIQGDVIGLVDETGSLVVEYTYDAWGKPLSITDGNGNAIDPNTDHVGNANPLRYRSYYWDTESSLYYLQSRYYDPEWGRFINADEPLTMLLQPENVLGTNLYAYCNNNPVIGYDPSGLASSTKFWWGWRVYLSNDETKRFVQGVGYAQTIMVPVIGKFGSWVAGAVVALIYNMKKDQITNRNKGKGVYIDFSYLRIAGLWWNAVLTVPLLPIGTR